MAAELIDIRPLLVRVHDDGWEPLPADDKAWTERERWLINEIILAGGISPTCRSGFYYMNVVNQMGRSMIEFSHVSN